MQRASKMNNCCSSFRLLGENCGALQIYYDYCNFKSSNTCFSREDLSHCEYFVLYIFSDKILLDAIF